MHISELSIRNYKNLYKNKFLFDDKITTIIGENGTGKTNIFHTLRLLLDQGSRMFLTEDSFSSILGSPKGHWIIISATFKNVGDSVEETHLKPLDDKSGVYTLIYRPKKQIRTQLYNLSEKISEENNSEQKELLIEELEEYISKIDIRSDYELKRTVSTIFDFLSESEYIKYVGDFENNIFPNPEIQDDKRYIGDNDLGFQPFINVTFIPAIRDVNAELTRDNNFLSRMLKNISEKVDISEWEQFEEYIKNINDGLSNIEEFTKFINEVDELTRRTVGDIYSTNIHLNMEIPSNKNNLMKYFSLKGKEKDNIYGLYNRSLGDNNIVYFALKLAESKMTFGHSRKVYNLLLIEEPEAHIHKFLQESLFKGIRDQQDDYQMLISTHSVHISESSKISSMIVLNKSDVGIKSFSPVKGLDKGKIDVIERYFDVTKTPILFSKTVWVVEGAAELLLIPTLFRLKYNIELSSLGISLISVDGSYFDSVSSLFHRERIQKYIAILTDGDKDYNEPNSNKEKNAQERNKKLLEQQKDNEYVFIGLSEYTFEIDFYRENIKSFKQFLKELNIYKRDTILEELNNSDEKIVYDRILKVCNLVGKGKMSYMYSEWLSTKNESASIIIPKYIEDSFDFLYKNIVGDKKNNDWKMKDNDN